MPRRRRFVISLVGLWMALTGAWLVWGPSPDPVPAPLPWKPDAIVILGGGDAARVRQGKLLADRFPEALIVVTGDGGSIVRRLLEEGVPEKRIVHEKEAESTMDNARLTAPFLENFKARRVALVTSWFHVPRALAVFRKEQPEINFAASFEAKPASVTKCDRELLRRERVASMLYGLRYGVWIFENQTSKFEKQNERRNQN